MDIAPMPGSQVLCQVREKLQRGEKASLLVTGTSMVPFLRDKKDWVLLEAVSEPPKCGQILLFRGPEDRLVLHRLRKKRKGYYMMNGDGQTRLEVIPPDRVEAVVTAVIRRSGRTIPCSSRWWRALCLLWWPTRPIRPLLLKWAAALKRLWKHQKGVSP